MSRASGPGLRRWVMWSAIALLLILPALAMRFTREVNWTASDFAAAAILLGGAGLIYELAASRIVHRTHRIGVAMVVGFIVLLVWAQGAVGIF
ncbi:putative exporter [Novosphingobium chloroacetimidivorans]|uniref:Putative exporter n=2 Tax=Novosphingobium chloroacetimidivorans TaxID=1428314 RepID=A0A7W7NVB3_9SPHN|nr:putative exporter [Novosphingobium chloroacetimidivorans]